MKTLSTFSGKFIFSTFILLFTFCISTRAHKGKEPSFNDGDGKTGKLGSASVVREFEVKKSKSGIQLSWKTANNNTASSFDVERSVGGSSFVKIAFLKSGKQAVYNFTDKNIYQPAYYYRIIMKSASGESHYSETIYISATTGKTTVKQHSANAGSSHKENKLVVSEKNKAAVPASTGEKTIYNLCTEEYSKLPVYFNKELDVVVHAEKAGVLSINLTALNGRIRMTRTFMAETGYNQISIEQLAPLPKGNYTLTVRTGQQLISRKAVKK